VHVEGIDTLCRNAVHPPRPSSLLIILWFALIAWFCRDAPGDGQRPKVRSLLPPPAPSSRSLPPRFMIMASGWLVPPCHHLRGARRRDRHTLSKRGPPSSPFILTHHPLVRSHRLVLQDRCHISASSYIKAEFAEWLALRWSLERMVVTDVFTDPVNIESEYCC
jgi:hypothetical protein